MVHTLNWSHLLNLKEMLMHFHLPGTRQQPSTSLAEATVWRCQICAFSTAHHRVLRQHYTTQHGIRQYRTQHVLHSDHMLHGLPQCRHCYQTFSSWRSHAIHIERGCQELHRLHLCAGTSDLGQTSAMPLLPTSLTNARANAAMRGQKQLGISDLRNIVSQEWGHRLLTLVGNRQFSQLIQEDSINEYLSQRCGLCAQWVGRAQEMHRHLRLFHSQYWPMVMAKSSQLSNLYATESPCRFCRCVFKTAHSCNTWTQISLLLIYGAGHLSTAMTPSSAALQCELCDLPMDTEEQLHLHLLTDHNLASARWIPSRDSIDGGSGCAHCGTVFSSVESLRSHIVQGRCQSFDPSLTCEPKEVTTRVKNALCHGGLTEALQDAHWRMQMTLHCQNCSHTSLRAGDLMLHLRSSHSQLWQESVPMTSLLIGMFYHLWGCICNPTTAAQRLNHICVPLKQLAMQYHRLPLPRVFCPLLVTEQMLARAYHPSLPRELKFELDRMMLTRNFQAVLRQPDMMHHLTHTCLLCAATFSAIDLGLHLREMHDCSTKLVSFYIQQLLPVMLEFNPLGHVCDHCGMIYDIPLSLQLADGNDHAALSDRAILSQNHYKAHCPGTLQLALFLCRVFNDGGHHHDRQSGGISAGFGGIPADGTADGGQVRSRPCPAAEPGAAEARQKRRRTGPSDGKARGGNSGSAQHGPDDGQAPGEARSSSSRGPERNSLPFLFQQQGSDRVIEIPGGSGRVLASDGHEATATYTMAAAETASTAGVAGGSPHSRNWGNRILSPHW